MVADVRKSLPLGVNDADMNERGERRGPLDAYGDAYSSKSVFAAMRAWGVLKWWLVNPTGLTSSPVPSPNRDGGPEYMLLFADGRWRYAKFGGVNGPPWTYCPWQGWEAPNGHAAFLMMRLEAAIERRKRAEDEVSRAADSVAFFKQELSHAMRQPERSDETWK